MWAFIRHIATNKTAYTGDTLKRVLDLAIATGALILASPLMLITAIAIRLTIGGPVIFSHERIGYGGRKFKCYKFRSMVNNVVEVRNQYFKTNPAAKKLWDKNQKLENDPAVTCIGTLLRRTSIDELPQVINVIMGDMSFVGPRPVTEKELLDKYGFHRARMYMRVRPGLTGLWQVKGRNNTSYKKRVLLDCYYVRKKSLWLDIKILFMTIPAILNTKASS
jgi:exopolysaccharide production protein ExoY